VDQQTLSNFETDLAGNLYKIWNRMSSGSYFPPPVLAVEIPKPHGGGARILGVPTIADRVAQTVVAGTWRRRSNRSSTRIPTDTGLSVRRWMRSRHAGNGAGDTTG
jgi:retron-type reverse transcriptase